MGLVISYDNKTDRVVDLKLFIKMGGGWLLLRQQHIKLKYLKKENHRK